jgi:hypothetical protein
MASNVAVGQSRSPSRHTVPPAEAAGDLTSGQRMQKTFFMTAPSRTEEIESPTTVVNGLWKKIRQLEGTVCWRRAGLRRRWSGR